MESKIQKFKDTENILQGRIVRQLRKTPWIRRRSIYRSLVEKDYVMDNEMEFKHAFMFLDVDRDGLLSANDLRIVVSYMDGKEPDEIDVIRWIKVFDMNHDGTISFHEFVATLVVKMDNFMTSDDIIDLYERCDVSNMGYITTRSVMQASALSGTNITVEDAMLMMKAVGSDCSRRIDFHEFNHMMKFMRKDILFCVGAILSN